MDKNEYNLKLQEIEQLVDQGNYAEAAAAADTIEWKRVRNVRTLCMVSEIYEAEDRYEDSKALLLRAYKRSPMGKNILYRLVEVTIALKQFDEAIEYYSEYVQVAPHDNNRYILKYKIYRGRGSSIDEQIEILKEYLDQEYNEKYAYELAKLYKEADRISECMATCDDLVLWFHSGKYVIRALELKMRYQPLTPKQQEIYDHRFDEEPEEDDDEDTIGQEKQIVAPTETSLQKSIVEDTERSIAQEVASVVSDGIIPGMAETEEAAAEASDEAGKTKVLPGEPVPTAEDEIREAAAQMTAAVSETEEEAVKADTPEAEEKDGINPEEPEGLSISRVDEQQEPEEDKAGAARISEETTQAEEEAVEGVHDPKEIADEIALQAAQKADMTQKVLNYNPEELASDVIRDMKDIVAGIGGKRDYDDEDAEAADRIIEESKKDQEAAMAARYQGGVTMRRKLEIPELQKKQAAGQLTIDDILLSMGDRGKAAREAAAKASIHTAGKKAPEGVLSAVDEALLNMGVTPKEPAGHDKPAEETEHHETAEAVQAPSAQGNSVQADSAREAGAEPEILSADAQKPDELTIGADDLADAFAPEEIETPAEEIPPQETETEPDAAGTEDENTESTESPEEEQSADESADAVKDDDYDILTAPTRRLPTEEIARLYAASEAEKLRRQQAADGSAQEMLKRRQEELAAAKAAEEAAAAKAAEEAAIRAAEEAAARAAEEAAAARAAEAAAARAAEEAAVKAAEEAAARAAEEAAEKAAQEAAAKLEADIKGLPETGTSRTETDEPRKETGATKPAAATAEQELQDELAMAMKELSSSSISDELPEDFEAAADIFGRKKVQIPSFVQSRNEGAAGKAKEASEDAKVAGAEEAGVAAGQAAEAVGEDAGEAAVAEDAGAAEEAAEAVGEDAGAEDAGVAAEEAAEAAGEDAGEAAVAEDAGAAEEAAEAAEADQAAEGEQKADSLTEDFGEGPRAQKNAQSLPPHLRGLFRGFLQVRGVESQIVNAIDQALEKGKDRTSRMGNILIYGAHGCGKTTLAVGLAKAIAQERGDSYVKMARIYATDLNRKDIAATIAKIAGGILIIEEAGDLQDAIADQLTTAMEFRTDGLIIIMEDEQKYIRDVLMRHPRFTMKFTSQINLPAYTTKELVGFGQVYADSKDYVLSDGAKEAFGDKIERVAPQLENGVVSVTNVIEMTDAAIRRANKLGRKVFAGKKRFDEQGRVILQEKDFK